MPGLVSSLLAPLQCVLVHSFLVSAQQLALDISWVFSASKEQIISRDVKAMSSPRPGEVKNKLVWGLFSCFWTNTDTKELISNEPSALNNPHPRIIISLT